MRTLRGLIAAALLLYVCAVLHWRATDFAILGASPDFLLLAVTLLTLFTNRAKGAGVGFLGGLLSGGLAGANLFSYIISRTLTGFVVSWSLMLEYERRLPLVALVVFLGTIFGELVMMFIAPPPGIMVYLRDTIATAMYNGVLAMPLYALLRRIIDPAERTR